MPSKKDNNKNPYAGWTDPALNDPALDRTLNRFIPPGFGKVKLEPEQPAGPTSAMPSEQLQLSVIAEAENKTQYKEIVTVQPPLAAPLAAPLVAPLEEQTFAPLDATHTASEQKIYSVMYRLTISKGKRERHFGNQELLRATGIRSPYTVRSAIDGLAAKRSVEIIWKSTGSNLGDRYRVYPPREIFARRREIGIEIDPQSKKIRNTEFSTAPLAAPLAAPPETRGAPLQKLEGRKSLTNSNEDTSAALLNILNHDDDLMMTARIRALDIIPALRAFFPDAKAEEIMRVAVEMAQLDVAQFQQWAAHAKTSPANPQYFLECKKRVYTTKTMPPVQTRTIAEDDEARAALRSAIAGAGEQELDRAIADLRLLDAGQIKDWAKRAATPPVSPQYFVECKRRLYAASERAEATNNKTGKRSDSRTRSGLKRKIEALAKQIREAYVGAQLTFADFGEALKRACAREDLPYDDELITETIEGLLKRRG